MSQLLHIFSSGPLSYENFQNEDGVDGGTTRPKMKMALMAGLQVQNEDGADGEDDWRG